MNKRVGIILLVLFVSHLFFGSLTAFAEELPECECGGIPYEDTTEYPLDGFIDSLIESVGGVQAYQQFLNSTTEVTLTAFIEYFDVTQEEISEQLVQYSLEELYYEVTGVELNRSNMNLEVGMVIPIEATVLPTNAAVRDIHWESSNPAVATVSDTGVVTAVSEGSALITVTTHSKGFTDVCAVTVYPYVQPLDYEVTEITATDATIPADTDFILTVTYRNNENVSGNVPATISIDGEVAAADMIAFDGTIGQTITKSYTLHTGTEAGLKSVAVRINWSDREQEYDSMNNAKAIAITITDPIDPTPEVLTLVPIGDITEFTSSGEFIDVSLSPTLQGTLIGKNYGQQSYGSFVSATSLPLGQYSSVNIQGRITTPYLKSFYGFINVGAVGGDYWHSEESEESEKSELIFNETFVLNPSNGVLQIDFILDGNEAELSFTDAPFVFEITSITLYP